MRNEILNLPGGLLPSYCPRSISTRRLKQIRNILRSSWFLTITKEDRPFPEKSQTVRILET